VNPPLDLPNHDEDVQKIVKKGLNDFEAFFERQLQLDISTCVIPAKVETSLPAIKLQAIDLIQ